MPAGRAEQAEEDLEERALAGPVRTDEPDDAGLDGDGEAVEGEHAAGRARIPVGEPVGRDQCHRAISVRVRTAPVAATCTARGAGHRAITEPATTRLGVARATRRGHPGRGRPSRWPSLGRRGVGHPVDDVLAVRPPDTTPGRGPPRPRGRPGARPGTSRRRTPAADRKRQRRTVGRPQVKPWIVPPAESSERTTPVAVEPWSPQAAVPARTSTGSATATRSERSERIAREGTSLAATRTAGPTWHAAGPLAGEAYP